MKWLYLELRQRCRAQLRHLLLLPHLSAGLVLLRDGHIVAFAIG